MDAATDLGWEPPVMLDADRPMNSWLDDVILSDATGTGAVVFARQGPRDEVWISRFAPGAGAAGSNWFPSEQLSQGEYSAGYPRAGADQFGNMVVAWHQWTYLTGYAIFASRFDVMTGWSQPVQIDQPSGYSYEPKVSTNSFGVTFVAWVVWDGARYNAYANRYDPGTGWGTAVTIDTTTQSTYEHRIGSDDSGNAVVTWMEWDGSRYNIMANRYAAGTGWTGPVALEVSMETAYYPRIGMDAQGNAIVTWIQYAAGVWSVWANRYDAVAGWGGAVPIEASASSACPTPPNVAVNRDNGVVSFVIYDGTYCSVYANRYVSGTGWVGEGLVEFYASTATHDEVAIDPAGNAFVTFRLVDPTDPTLSSPRAVRYDVGLGFWTGTYILDSARAGLYTMLIDTDNAGNALIAWPYDEDPTDESRSGLRARRYIFGGGFQAAQAAEWDQESTTTPPYTAWNDQGHVVSAWLQDDGVITNAYASVYTPGVGWSDPTRIENLDYQSVTEITTAMDPDGNALALFRAYDGMKWAVFASRYDVTSRAWGLPVRVDTLPGDVYWLRVAMGAGSGIAVWQQWDGSSWSIFGNLYDTVNNLWMGSPWSLESSVDYAYGSHIAMDPAGNAIAVWSQWGGSGYDNYANHYAPMVGWSGPVLIETTAGYAGYPQIAMNRNGVAFVSWSWWTGTQYNAAGTYYHPMSGWGPEATFEFTPENAFVARPAVDDLGNGFIVWQVWEGSDWDLWGIRGSAGAGWGQPFALETSTGDAVDASVSLDRRGNGFACWTQWNGVNWDINARRYATGQGWLSTVRLEELPESAGICTVAVDGAGNGMATWYQWDQDVLLPWAARYIVGDGLPSLTITSPADGLVTNDPVIILRGSTDIGATVTVDGFVASVQPDGTFAYLTVLSDGEHTFVVVAQNAAGLTRTATLTVTIDTVVPALVVLSPSNGAITNVPNQWVSGFTEPGATVDVDGITATVGPSGAFGLTEGMVEGLNTFIVSATDAAGNSAAVAVQVTLDMTAPALTVTSPFPGVTNNPVFVVEGMTEPGASVTVDGTPAFVSPSGTYQSGQITLLEGPHTFQVVSTDAAGNSATASVPVTVDTIAPNVVITSPANGLVTRNDVLSVTGITDVDAEVTVNGIAVSVDSSGYFSGTIALAEGTQVIRADATDPAGNLATAQITVTVDQTPPDLYVGSPADGSITNSGTVTVSGTTEPGATVTVDGVAVPVSPTGAFSRTLTLPDGVQVIGIAATDAAGNVAEATVTVQVDTIAPPVSILTPAAGATVVQPTVTVTGTTEPGARLVVNGFSVEVDAAGDFAIRLALAVGANAITATATDAAGNTASDAVSVTYVDPLPGVWQDLNDTQADLDATNQELDETRTRLDNTLIVLGDTQQTLNNTRADLATTNANLASLGTQSLLLLILVIVSLALGAMQFIQLRKLQAQRKEGAGPPREGSAPPPPSS